MTDKQIKEPCPFCGNVAENIQIINFRNGMNKIKCPNCSATFEGLHSKQEIINKWNGRYR